MDQTLKPTELQPHGADHFSFPPDRDAPRGPGAAASPGAGPGSLRQPPGARVGSAAAAAHPATAGAPPLPDPGCVFCHGAGIVVGWFLLEAPDGGRDWVETGGPCSCLEQPAGAP